MGAWGIRALDSDEGLDTLDFLAESYLPEHKTIDLAEVIAWMREFDCLGENPDDIDLFYVKKYLIKPFQLILYYCFHLSLNIFLTI